MSYKNPLLTRHIVRAPLCTDIFGKICCKTYQAVHLTPFTTAAMGVTPQPLPLSQSSGFVAPTCELFIALHLPLLQLPSPNPISALAS